MVAQAEIENLQSRLHALRGTIWRERQLTRTRADTLRREVNVAMRRGCTPADAAALQSLLHLTDCLFSGLARPA